MTGLPQGWSSTPFKNILSQIVGGGTPSKANPSFFDGAIPFMTVKDLYGRFPSDTIDHVSETAIANSATTVVPSDTLIVATRMSLGKIVRPTVSVAINQDLKALFLADGIDKTYIEYFWRSQSERINSLGTGTTVKGIRLEDIRELVVPLAPLPEQKRIADKLDSVVARVDACRNRLNRLPALLKRFRLSILNAATSGAITEDWRAKRAGLPIRKARHDVEQREQARKTAVKVRGLSINVAPELLYDLPSSWDWIDNYRLADDKANAICAGPFGTIFKAKDFREKGVPILFLRHVGAGMYLTRKPGFMDEAVWKNQHQEYSVYGGELLVTKLGDPPGSSCIYPIGIGTAMVTPDVMKMCVDEVVCHPKYLMHYFNSSASKKIVESVCFGVTRLRIDLSLFKTFPVPLPPIDEQAEIVRRVEILFEFGDRLEARLATARMQIGQLTPALLAKAFRGELVSQDPADEPATELLKRLAELRSVAPQAKRCRKAAR